MSTATYFYVNKADDANTQQLVSLFTYNYLVHPISFNKSNKFGLLYNPIEDFFLKPLDWKALNDFITEIENIKDGDLMADVWQILQNISFASKRYASFNCLIITSLNKETRWATYINRLEDILKQINNINITLIDTTSDTSSPIHNLNLTEWSKYAKVITLTEAIQCLTKWGLQVSKIKKPVEVYGYRMDIMEMFDFSVSVYPYAKKNLIGDYISTKTVSTDMDSVSYKYEYEEEGTFVEGFKFGSSILTDLPSTVFVQEIEKCLSITGFIEGSVPPWYLKNDPLVVWPGKNADEKDIVIFNELWSSMVRKKVYATVRYVKRKGMDVKHGVLFPKCFINKETTTIDNGAFIFVETIFKDEEKLVSVPNLMKIKPKYDFDSILEDMNLDKNEKLLPLDFNIITMNEDKDMFSKIQEKYGRNPFYKTTTSKLLRQSNPLISIERLIYLSSYILAEKNREMEGNSHDTLAEMAKREGIPTAVIEKWLNTAKYHVFRPKLSEE